MKNHLLAVPLALFLASCATAPSRQELATADYGTVPTNYEQIIKEHCGRFLKDPYSAQYQFSKPEAGWLANSPLTGGERAFGYVVHVTLNAKNSFGGYVGAEEYRFLIHNGVVVMSQKRSRDGSNWWPTTSL